MSLVKPTLVEGLCHTFFNLEPDRPEYYNLVFRLARSIFLRLNFDDKVEEMEIMIKTQLEEPLNAPLFAILQAYYNPRFMFSKLAYCRIGRGVDAKIVTRYDMTVRLEHIKDWAYDEVTNLSQFVRFTRHSDMTA